MGAGFSAQVIPGSARIPPGGSVTLRCSHNSSDQSVRYSWSREDGQALTGFQFETLGRSKDRLRISSAGVGDSGVYICSVETDSGTLTGRSDVFVGKFVF